jgi:hypothetical protein
MRILDANVMIHLYEFGIWSNLIALCDVHLPVTVVDESDCSNSKLQTIPFHKVNSLRQRRASYHELVGPETLAAPRGVWLFARPVGQLAVSLSLSLIRPDFVSHY